MSETRVANSVRGVAQVRSEWRREELAERLPVAAVAVQPLAAAEQPALVRAHVPHLHAVQKPRYVRTSDETRALAVNSEHHTCNTNISTLISVSDQFVVVRNKTISHYQTDSGIWNRIEPIPGLIPVLSCSMVSLRRSPAGMKKRQFYPNRSRLICTKYSMSIR